MGFNRKVFVWHSWLGLFAGLFVLIFFLTGALIVFSHEMEHTENPHLTRVVPLKEWLPFDDLYRNARSAADKNDVFIYSFYYVPQSPNESISMRCYNSNTKKYGLAYINPYTGDYLGETYGTVADTLVALHYTFLAGRFGEFLAGIFAFCLMGSIITGFYVYRRHLFDGLLFRFRAKKKDWKAYSSYLHRVLGVWGLLFNFVLAFSGFYMMIYVFDLKTHFGTNSSKSMPTPPEITQNLDVLIEKTKARFPDFRFGYMDFPREEGQDINLLGDLPGNLLLGEWATRATFSNSSGELISLISEEELSNWEKFEYCLYTLHYGQFGGIWLKILYCIFALLGAISTVTGFLLYSKRSKFFEKEAFKTQYSKVHSN